MSDSRRSALARGRVDVEQPLDDLLVLERGRHDLGNVLGGDLEVAESLPDGSPRRFPARRSPGQPAPLRITLRIEALLARSLPERGEDLLRAAGETAGAGADGDARRGLDRSGVETACRIRLVGFC